jgi:hypothetical protein
MNAAPRLPMTELFFLPAPPRQRDENTVISRGLPARPRALPLAR